MVLYNFGKSNYSHTHLCSAQSHSTFYPKEEPIWQMGWPVSDSTNHITATILEPVHLCQSGQGS